MRKVLSTGMSGVGKSSALDELERRGFEVVDTDRGGWSPLVGYRGRLRLARGPAEVLLRRIATRTTNDYGKRADERDLILRELVEVEPLLRASCTHEIDATRALDVVVAELVAIGN